MLPDTQARLQTIELDSRRAVDGYTTKETFHYSGNVIRLQSKLDALQMNKGRQFKDVYIHVTGNQAKQRSQACEIVTWIFGAILIFPTFFMCCNWWRRIVYPAYDIPVSTYQKLQPLILSPTINSITLIVNDSGFNLERAQILYGLLSKSNAKGFSFTNQSTPNDFREKEYTNFRKKYEENQRPVHVN